MGTIRQGINDLYGTQKVKAVKLNLDTTGTIAVSGTKLIEIRPPETEAWRIQILTARAQVPSGGASGTHRFEIMLGENDIYNKVVYGYNDWNAEVYLTMNYFKTAKAPMEPAAADGQIMNLKSILITHDAPLYIKYSNLTNVVQDKGLIIRAVLESVTL
jgi:hypothetical protein